MKDTSLGMERKFRKMLLERSAGERLKMGCSMHASSQALVKDSVLRKQPNASPAVLKRTLFLRFYGNDFGPGERKRIMIVLERAARSGKSRWRVPNAAKEIWLP